jgi:hypothetical protein
VPPKKNAVIFVLPSQKKELALLGRIVASNPSKNWIFVVPGDEKQLFEFNLRRGISGKESTYTLVPSEKGEEFEELSAHLKNRKIEQIFWFVDSVDRKESRGVLHRELVDRLEILFSLEKKMVKNGIVHFLSTVEVQGTGGGILEESLLETRQKFMDNYEEMKYLAEKKVRDSELAGRTVIYRTGFMVGENKKALKDFPFPGFIDFNAVSKWPSFLPLPIPGNGKYFLPLTPVKYFESVLQTVIGEPKKFIARTLHVVDPHPYTLRALVRMFRQEKEAVPGLINLGEAGKFLYRKLRWADDSCLRFWDMENKYSAEETEKILKFYNIRCGDLADYYKNFLL